MRRSQDLSFRTVNCLGLANRLEAIERLLIKEKFRSLHSVIRLMHQCAQRIGSVLSTASEIDLGSLDVHFPIAESSSWYLLRCFTLRRGHMGRRDPCRFFPKSTFSNCWVFLMTLPVCTLFFSSPIQVGTTWCVCTE